MRRVELRFDSFGWEVLEAEGDRLYVAVEALISRAVVYFEGQMTGGRQAVQLPSGEGSLSGEVRVLELEIRDGTWQRLRREASRQKVDVERLVEHAALLFIADLDAGRVTEKFL